MALTLEEKTRLCVLAADSRKAEDIVILDVQAVSSVADHFMICHGNSDRQVKAIADAIIDETKKQGERPIATEGYQEGSWILLDYADLVIHVFDAETRRFYDLEHLWGNAATVTISGLGSLAAPSASPATFIEK